MVKHVCHKEDVLDMIKEQIVKIDEKLDRNNEKFNQKLDKQFSRMELMVQEINRSKADKTQVQNFKEDIEAVSAEVGNIKKDYFKTLVKCGTGFLVFLLGIIGYLIRLVFSHVIK